MADIRIKDIVTTSTAVLADDWTVTDGLTSGTRKIKPALMAATAMGLRAAPSSASDTGAKGEMALDTDGFLYLCIATDTWVRFAGASWS